MFPCGMLFLASDDAKIPSWCISISDTGMASKRMEEKENTGMRNKSSVMLLRTKGAIHFDRGQRGARSRGGCEALQSMISKLLPWLLSCKQSVMYKVLQSPSEFDWGCMYSGTKKKKKIFSMAVFFFFFFWESCTPEPLWLDKHDKYTKVWKQHLFSL